MIYLAPLQGFTDFVYRKAYAKVFGGVSKFFIPYISIKNSKVLPKYYREILPEHNPQNHVVPQVLAKDGSEIVQLAKLVSGYGYEEINLNIGCPYPMVTRRGKGAGILSNPGQLDDILYGFFANSSLELSVKMRAGLNSENEIEHIIPVLNKYPLKELIVHPRIASQLYSGDLYENALVYAQMNTVSELVFNGDIVSHSDFSRRKLQFPEIENWMIGRGILMNPFLPEEISGTLIPDDERIERLKSFHQLILDDYLHVMDNEGNALNKMKQFWSYFCFVFPESKKAFKRIKKAASISALRSEVAKLFASI